MGRVVIEGAGGRPVGQPVRHGAFLPDAGHFAERGCAAGGGVERRAQIDRKPNPGGCRLQFHRAGEGRGATRNQSGRLQGSFRRLGAGNDFGG